MARRPRRRHRPKTISRTGVTGQKGVNPIERGCVLFWAEYLKPKPNLFAQDGPPISVGDLLVLDCPVGINDKQWLSHDPEFGKDAADQRDALLLPDIDDLFTS
jgi:hypothetical protein